MQAALQLARQAVPHEVPVGAVLVNAQGAVIASAHNLVETRKDPTAHAEMLVIQAACTATGSPRLQDCDLYVTLEPCAMCAQAISLARIRRVYYGAPDPKGGAIDHGPRLYQQPTCHHAPEIIAGLAESECGELLKAFFRSRR
jgi:tRNA(adenine34) deaminase